MQGTANIMEGAIYGAIFSAFPARVPMALTMNYSKASSTQREEPGSIVNRFSARRLPKSEVQDNVKRQIITCSTPPLAILPPL